MTDRDGKVKGFAGVALYDFTRPDLAVTDVSFDRQPITYKITAGFKVYDENQFSVTPNLFATTKRTSGQLQLGSWFNYDLSAHSDNKLMEVGLGIWYKTNRTMIFGLQYFNQDFKVVLGYDIPSSIESNSVRNNALELALNYRISDGINIKLNSFYAKRSRGSSHKKQSKTQRKSQGRKSFLIERDTFDIPFDQSSSELNLVAEEDLKAIIPKLRKKNSRVFINGFMTVWERENLNRDLIADRQQEVINYLLINGIVREQIEVIERQIHGISTIQSDTSDIDKRIVRVVISKK